MTFLNPFMLFGLAAASIPVIIHLFSLRKLRIVEFSSVRFLKELQRTQIRRLKLRQWLLLLLRTLLVLAVVFAFSRPALHGAAGGRGVGQASTTMVIILDDSPSMSLRNDAGRVFQQAQAEASNAVGVARDDDRLTVIRLSEAAATVEIPRSLSMVAAREEIDASVVSQSSGSMTAAFRTAHAILTGATSANKEIILITDAQASQFGEHAAQSDTLPPFPEHVNLFLAAIPSPQKENSGITSVTIESRIISRNAPLEVRTSLRNFGTAPLSNALVSIYLDGTRVGQEAVDAGPGSAATRTFRVVPKRSGIIEGYIESDNDPFEEDNRRHFVVPVPERLSVALVGPSAAATVYPTLALTAGGDSTGVFDVRNATEDRLASLTLDGLDALILCGVRTLDGPESERIAHYVQTGGGLLVFPGADSGLSSSCKLLLDRLHVPPVQDPVQTGEGAYISFGRVDYSHPLFQGLFDLSGLRGRRGPSIETPRLTRALPIHPGSRGRSMITMSNGESFLAEWSAGNGRVLLCAVDAGLGWSDFAAKPIFAPLLHRAVLYLCTQGQPGGDVIVGSPLSISVPSRGFRPNDSFTLRPPSGTDERIVPATITPAGAARFESGPTRETGVYELRRSSTAGSPAVLCAAVAVGPPTPESDLRRATDQEQEDFVKRMGIAPNRVTMVSPGESMMSAVTLTRVGVELWEYLLALAAACAVAELIVGRSPKEEA